MAYRYFSTPRRKFIIADTPGHVQYTRNMATGASTANLAIILIDARQGVLPQSRRHAFIASLLGIQHIVVAVNKMDLVDYSEAAFERIRAEFTAYAARLQAPDLHFIPISALHGDNVVKKSVAHAVVQRFQPAALPGDGAHRQRPQHDGIPLSGATGDCGRTRSSGDTRGRWPRGWSGRATQCGVAFGAHHAGAFDRDIRWRTDEAFPPMSVALVLEDELDIGRGDMLAPPSHPPRVARRLDARMVWMRMSRWRRGATTCSSTPPRRCGPPCRTCATG